MNSFSTSFNETIRGSEEFIAELADTAIESVVDSDTLSKIPILSWAFQVYKIKNSYHLKKIQRNTKAFLVAIKKGNTEKMLSLISSIGNDDKYKEEFMDNLLNILFESEKPIKAEILGNLTVALSDEKITQTEFDDLSMILIPATIPALNALTSFIKAYGELSLSIRNIEQEPLLLSMGIGSRYGTHFGVSKLGNKLYTYGLKMLT